MPVISFIYYNTIQNIQVSLQSVEHLFSDGTIPTLHNCNPTRKPLRFSPSHRHTHMHTFFSRPLVFFFLSLFVLILPIEAPMYQSIIITNSNALTRYHRCLDVGCCSTATVCIRFGWRAEILLSTLNITDCFPLNRIKIYI